MTRMARMARWLAVCQDPVGEEWWIYTSPLRISTKYPPRFTSTSVNNCQLSTGKKLKAEVSSVSPLSERIRIHSDEGLLSQWQKEAAALSTVPDIPIKGNSVWGFLQDVARSYFGSARLDSREWNGSAGKA